MIACIMGTLLELGPLDKGRLMKTCGETIALIRGGGGEITLCTIAKISGKGIIE